MLKYRPDIDGLRTVAVLPVLFCHAGFPGFSGGFVGVDVFFVISGYLISGIILEETAAGRFSLLGFYERRIRRILPMLFTVVGLTAAAGCFLMLPYQLEALSKGTLAVALFGSNVYFWLTHGYFSASADLNPLLHTWSLAVEEQFYVVFPLALVILLRIGKTITAVCFVLAAVFSLALAQVGGNLNFSPPYIEPEFQLFAQPAWASFFLPTGRLFEFLVGTVAVVIVRSSGSIPLWCRQIGSAMGLALIVWAIVRLDDRIPFPSVYTLIPVVGAGLILVLSSPETVVGRLLAWKLPVGLGLISYSLYLWHQPLFAYARLIADHPPGPDIFAALIVLAMVLSYFSWRFIETPFRRGDGFSRRSVFACAAGATVALIVLALVGIVTQGFAARFPQQDREMVTRSPEAWGRYVAGRFDALRGDVFPAASARPRLLVIGDSYAQDFINMGAETGWLSAFDVRTFYIPEKCQPYLGDENIERFVREDYRAFCRNSRTLADAAAVLAQADAVVMASRWFEWSVRRLPETIRRMNLRPDQRLVVIGSKSFGVVNFNKLARLPADRRAAYRVKAPLPVNTLLGASLPDEGYVDVQALLCGQAGNCPLFTPEGQLIAFDSGHLTSAGARYVGALVVRQPSLARLVGATSGVVR